MGRGDRIDGTSMTRTNGSCGASRSFLSPALLALSPCVFGDPAAIHLAMIAECFGVTGSDFVPPPPLASAAPAAPPARSEREFGIDNLLV